MTRLGRINQAIIQLSNAKYELEKLETNLKNLRDIIDSTIEE